MDHIPKHQKRLLNGQELIKQKVNWKPKVRKNLRTVGKALHRKIKLNEVKSVIVKLNKNKSAGPDLVPNEFFQWAGPTMIQMLFQLFNTIHKEERVPESWNSLFLVCLFKGKGDPADLQNYRGLALNNTISKIFAEILNKRLTAIVEKFNMLGEMQAGGRKGRQGNDHLFTLRSILDKYRSKASDSHGEGTFVFVDLKKAFDTVPRNHLWAEMENFGLGGKFLN